MNPFLRYLADKKVRTDRQTDRHTDRQTHADDHNTCSAYGAQVISRITQRVCMCVDKYSPLQMTNDLTKCSEILTKHVNRRCLSLFGVLINVHLFLLHYLLYVYISLSAADLTTSLCLHFVQLCKLVMAVDVNNNNNMYNPVKSD